MCNFFFHGWQYMSVTLMFFHTAGASWQSVRLQLNCADLHQLRICPLVCGFSASDMCLIPFLGTEQVYLAPATETPVDVQASPTSVCLSLGLKWGEKEIQFPSSFKSLASQSNKGLPLPHSLLQRPLNNFQSLRPWLSKVFGLIDFNGS